jgi:hypothetical protein
MQMMVDVLVQPDDSVICQTPVFSHPTHGKKMFTTLWNFSRPTNGYTHILSHFTTQQSSGKIIALFYQKRRIIPWGEDWSQGI